MDSKLSTVVDLAVLTVCVLILAAVLVVWQNGLQVIS